MKKAKYITSVINHNIRVLLGLDCAEYAVMECLHEFYHEQPVSMAIRISNRLGYSIDESQDIINDLVAGKMIYLSTDLLPLYIINQKWLEQFSYDHDFAEFWLIFRQYGNKISAHENYKKVRKIIDKETLHAAAKAYLEYCDQTYSDTKYVNTAQIWLNPKTRKWEDALRLAPSKQEETTESILRSL